MDLDDPLPPIEQETLPTLSPKGPSKSSDIPNELTPEDAPLTRTSAIPFSLLSPPSTSRLTPGLRTEQFQYQKHPTSRPLIPSKCSLTPPQTSRRSPTNLDITTLNTPSRLATSRHTSSSFVPHPSASTSLSRSSSVATTRDMERKPVSTAASVAQEHFEKELAAHDSTGMSSNTVVIIHDSCYGHRYSRPRTSKAALSTIVERPERLHACILGASAAYVRIGSRHAGGKFPPNPNRDIPLPPFAIRKTNRSIPFDHPAVVQVHGSAWMRELQIMCDSAEGKLVVNGKELIRPTGYGKDDLGNPLPRLHEGDLYLCSGSLEALRGCLGGVCEAVDTVFGPNSTSKAFVCIRPPGHHCSSNVPSGFCWLNNVHVGIAHAAMSQGLTHAAIIDFDLHHGDGSQAIAWGHNCKAAGNLPKNASPYSKTPIGYFSLHDINSYPCEGGDEEKIKNASLCIEAAHGQSIWNVHLEPWKSHTDFWKLYESRYSILLEKTRIFLRQHTARLESGNNGTKAKAAIFLSAGFDASEWEGAGMQRHNVNVPTDFYARFTSDVTNLADEEGLGVDGRIISVLEGGYSDRALTSGVLSHLCGLTSRSGQATSSTVLGEIDVTSTIATQMEMLNVDSHTSRIRREESPVQCDTESAISYDPDWWSILQLEALEALTKPAPTPIAQVKSKDKTPSNYSSPTQASTAKMTDPARERRSLSAQVDGKASIELESVQSIPDVDWTVASYELSQLLIPTDRQTLSCRPDELNATATKARQERQSAIGLASNDLSAGDQRMQLRDRKPKIIGAEDLVKGVPKADRRKTIAAVVDLPGPAPLQNEGHSSVSSVAGNRTRRRSSGGSSMLAAFENMNLNHGSIETSRARAVVGRGEMASNRAKIPTLTAKAANAAVQKKPRRPSAVKAQSVRAKPGHQKIGPVPPVSKARSASGETSSDAINEGGKLATDKEQSAHQPNTSAVTVTGAEDMALLSSGMSRMKIRLKVPSPEENAASEKKAAEAKEDGKRARALKKPAVSKAANVPLSKNNRHLDRVSNPTLSAVEKSSTNIQNAPLASPTTPIRQSEQRPKPVMDIRESASTIGYVPTADIARAEPPFQATVPAPAPAPVPAPVENEPTAAIGPVIDGSQITPEEPSSNGPQISAGSTEPIHHSPPPLPAPLEPNDPPLLPEFPSCPVSAPAAAKKTRANLPRFTASSPIPFAKLDHKHPPSHFTEESLDKAANPDVSGVQVPWLNNDGIAWEADRDPGQQTNELAAEHNPLSHSPSSSTVAVNDHSICEVPETPRC